MRRLILLIVCFLPIYGVFAQAEADFTCNDTTNYRSQLTIAPPDISASLPDIKISAIGQNNYEPVIGISTENDVTDCYLSDIIEMDNDTISNLAEGLVYGFGTNNIQLSELNGEAGRVRFIFEALILDTEHNYQFNFSQEIVNIAEENSTVYLVSLSEAFVPSLTILDAQANQTDAQVIDISTLDDFNEGNSAVSAPMPADSDITLTITANQLGIYALIIDLNMPQVAIDDGVAHINRLEDGAIRLECNTEVVFENGLEVILPEDDVYTATVLANNIDPILAVVNADETGFCYDNAPTANYYFADLPSATMTPNRFNAQAIISPDNQSIIFGGYESAEGDYAVIIEGGTLIAEGDTDIFDISLTPQMLTQDRLLRAYVFAIDTTLNPILTWEDETGALLTCNDAGIDELCDQELDDFSSASLALGFNQRLLSVNTNPMLEIPVNNLSEANRIRLSVSADEGTFGSYVLVLHLVTD